MTLSVFDIFKVGIGPSSSHTMGPMRAAREFALGLERDGLLALTDQVAVRLYGSLALTGAGHGTDRAVLAGLEGAEPETVDPDSIDPLLQRIRSTGRIKLLGRHDIAFDEPMQLLFMYHERLPRHSNGMRFTALAGSKVLREEADSSFGVMNPSRTRRAYTRRHRIRSIRVPSCCHSRGRTVSSCLS
jgi:L-serine dehydratase